MQFIVVYWKHSKQCFWPAVHLKKCLWKPQNWWSHSELKSDDSVLHSDLLLHLNLKTVMSHPNYEQALIFCKERWATAAALFAFFEHFSSFKFVYRISKLCKCRGQRFSKPVFWANNWMALLALKVAWTRLEGEQNWTVWQENKKQSKA